MATVNTPLAEQMKIVLFGLRNAGKSSLMNHLFKKEVVIVSDTPGTTTDPVTRSMEMLPLGPVAVTDTAGLDDEGNIGELRMARTEEELSICDVPVLVTRGDRPPESAERDAWERIRAARKSALMAVTFGKNGMDPQKLGWISAHPHAVIDNHAETGMADLKKLLISQAEKAVPEITPVEGLVWENDLVLLVTPIDLAAPKGRLILPQVETIRDLLDRDCAVLIVKERELKTFYDSLNVRPALVITDSQVFCKVAADIPPDQPLTSFSILFARKKGDLSEFVRGVHSISSVDSASRILVLESCAHHKQADDIGTVKIPRLFRQLVKSDAEFIHSREIPSDEELKDVKLVIQCAGCMVTRNHMMKRLGIFKEKGIPVVNYGLFLAWANGLLPRAIEPFPFELSEYLEMSN